MSLSSDGGSQEKKTDRVEESITFGQLNYFQDVLRWQLEKATESFEVILPGNGGECVHLVFGGSPPPERSSSYLYFMKADALRALVFKGYVLGPEPAVGTLELTASCGRTLAISVKDMTFSAPVNVAASQLADEDEAQPKKARAPRVAKADRSEEQVMADREKFTSRTGFLRKKGHPVSLWILHEMARIDNGERPICGEGDNAFYAPPHGLSLMMGRGTQPKFLYSVLCELKVVSMDMYMSRSDVNAPVALVPQLAAQEVDSLETAFQNTLNTWYTATRGWMKSCKATRGAGGEPSAITYQQANKENYFCWVGFKYAKPDKAAKPGKVAKPAKHV